MQIELTQQEIDFLTNELDYRLKKCTPLGHPTTNTPQLPKPHAEFYNALYKKINHHDHIDFVKYQKTLK